MNISLNWLREFVPFDQPADRLAETLTNLGLAVDAHYPYENIPGGLQGVVVGKVVECHKHPNADRLSLTKVNIGGPEILQIVCGAPNVAAGQTVLVATVGSVLHTSKGDKLEIKKGKIRGEVSEGMICAGDELSINDDHAGIIVLADSWPAGTAASDIYPIYKDVIFEIDLTPNRSDATSHMGVAKDLAAYLTIHESDKYRFKTGLEEDFEINDYSDNVKVVVEDSTACPRYSGISIAGVEVGPSPEWLQHRLKAIGVKAINNVVDVTNYILHAYGQPLHAFDLDKIGGRDIRVKKLTAGTSFLCLDGIERKLHEEDLMICNGDSKPMCIAGVFGGLDSGISQSTTSLFLESAHFNAMTIRRTSMRHVLRTDAATRFEKGTDPNGTIKALKVAASMIIQIAGGKLTSPIVDICPEPIKPVQLTIHYNKVRAVIGHALTNQEIDHILRVLEMTPVHINNEAVQVSVPTNKADVKREIDVIEEILRIYGYNKVPMPAKMEVSFANSSDAGKKQNAKETLASILVADGFSEIMGMSIMESKILKSASFNMDHTVTINNTSNVQLDTMRPDLLRSGLISLQFNQNRQQTDLKLFEFGKTYTRNVQQWPFLEHDYAAIYVSGSLTPEHWQLKDKKQGIFYLKGLLDQCLTSWGLTDYKEESLDHADFDFGFQINSHDQTLIQYGKLQDGLCKTFDLRGEVYYAQLDWERIWKLISLPKTVKIKIPSKYPGVRRDLAIIVDKNTTWHDISTVLSPSKIPHLSSYKLFDVFEQEERVGKDKKSMAIAFNFENDQETLKDVDLDKSMARIQTLLADRLKASLR